MNLSKMMSAVLLLCIICIGCSANSNKTEEKETSDSPRIINIINFIRQTDYRVENADSLLFETVQEQVKLLNRYNLPGTFLLQYDALINPLYQDLLKKELNADSEIGGWWEITQPHVEAAGIKWRGEHSWVSHANIAFTTGYSPQEREKLVDVYMAKFKEIFGKYPTAVGSWFIDSHTLAYMHDKYKIVASCNCKDQIGTDGYTLWGGYWNQAYYPSKLNAYMPAQTAKNQIPVPIFRMLGSDPIYQYDQGLGGNRQGVISLEPVYRDSGMDKNWVEYFLESIVNQPSLAFNYAQAGQENSFTWKGMQKGLEMQIPIFDSLRKLNKIKVETLTQSGTWFKEQFDVTPATAVTTLTDIRNEGNKSVWFNSRYYRTNLLWEGTSFRFRDIHLFDERFESQYLNKAGEGGQFFYFTLPIVDGFMWSTKDKKSGLRVMQLEKDGTKKEVLFKNPIVTELAKDVLQVECDDAGGNTFKIIFYENRFEVSCKPSLADFSWVLELTAAPGAELPFQSIEGKQIKAEFRGFKYGITCKEGKAEKSDKVSDYVFRLIPANNKLVLDCTNSL
ncbi:hypothetical protein [Dysgonomonas sp. ZJ279]|uniref:hypothetical protein n=1 Tax=Dysgonomonas sp. ZJ279 TaxID=2709796 RepID=UPI0013EBFF5C|nr:hypothetical protein [Dysgonomonas sp. ZJ279]